MKVYIFPNLDKKHSFEYTAEACSILRDSGIELLMDEVYRLAFSELGYISFGSHVNCIRECELVIVIGGDGTILKTSRFFAKTSCTSLFNESLSIGDIKS